MGNSKKTINDNVGAIICPHAGYMYCGGTAAYSYHHVNVDKINRVFILGPDHCGATHSGKHRAMLSNATHWQTPFGNINVDTNIINKLYQTKNFDLLTMKQDASEHSMELIVPFLFYIFYSKKNQNNNNKNKKEQKSNDNDEQQWNSSFKIIPIMIGNCKPKQHELYGSILSEYFDDESTLFVISSDFCHWGYNYGYTPFDKENYKKGHYHQYIKDLDFMGIQFIEKLDYNGFYKYLNNTQNTICGQHPICVLLNIVIKSKKKNKNNKYQIKFVNYSQSSKVTNMNEYSVSYAAGILYQQ